MPTAPAVTLANLMRPVFVATVMLATMVLPAAAVGPDGLLDGVWFIQERVQASDRNPYYASVHQNGGTVVAILLSLEGEWIYVVGTRSESTVQGTVYFSDGEASGTFSITVTSPTTLTGQSSFGGVTTPLVGTKVF